MNYPEYINGVKQEQNILKRLGILVWYSSLFRVVFVLLGFIWIIPMCFYVVELFPSVIDDIRQIGGFIYFMLIYLASKFNNFSNLRRVGRDERYHLIPYEKEIVIEKEKDDFIFILEYE